MLFSASGAAKTTGLEFAEEFCRRDDGGGRDGHGDGDGDEEEAEEEGERLVGKWTRRGFLVIFLNKKTWR